MALCCSKKNILQYKKKPYFGAGPICKTMWPLISSFTAYNLSTKIESLTQSSFLGSNYHHLNNLDLSNKMIIQ